jgi:predicted metal-binding protein
MNPAVKKKIKNLCLAQKAKDAKFIESAQIVVGYWTRYKCQYGCGAYGKNLCCPPNAPTPGETKKILSEYSSALLVRFGNKVKVTPAIAALEREVFLMDYYKVVGFGAGPCRLCDECSLSECRFPEEARPSMEACGIDVYATVRKSGFPLHVLTSEDERQNRYGLLLIE